MYRRAAVIDLGVAGVAVCMTAASAACLVYALFYRGELYGGPAVHAATVFGVLALLASAFL